MDQQELISIIVNGIFMYLAYKIGQVSTFMKIGQTERQKIINHSNLSIANRVITVEEINGIYYAYDGNDFLAQASNPDELGKKISTRYPDKYSGARIQIRA